MEIMKGCAPMEEKKQKFTGYISELSPYAKRLRKNMTAQERCLWYAYLRNYPIKFYRQRPIDHFIADFYCSKAHLVIELDGGQHFEPAGMSYDQYRDSVLRSYGLTVIRFSNADVDRNLRGVCEYIDLIVEECLHLAEQTKREYRVLEFDSRKGSPAREAGSRQRD